MEREFIREVARVADRHGLTHFQPSWEFALAMSERSLEDAVIPNTSTVTLDFTVHPAALPPGKAFASLLRKIEGAGIDTSRIHWIGGSEVAGATVSSVIDIYTPDGVRLSRREREDVQVQDLGKLLERAAFERFRNSARKGIQLSGTRIERTPECRRLFEAWIESGSKGKPPTEDLAESAYEHKAITVQELRREALQMRGKQENVLAIRWAGDIVPPASPYRVRLHLERTTPRRLKMGADQMKGRAGTARVRAKVHATEVVASKPEGRAMLEVPLVLGLMELFQEVVGVSLKAPTNADERKFWQEDVLTRIADLQPALEALDRKFIFLQVKPGMRRDELTTVWPRVEEYRRRRGHRTQGENLYARWLIDHWSALLKQKLSFKDIETKFQAAYPIGGYCDNCQSKVWTATRADPCPACAKPVTRTSGNPNHPGHKVIRERMRRAGRLG